MDLGWSMLTTLKMARSQWSYRKKVQQDAVGKVKIVKEIRRRGKDGLKINQHHFVRKKVWNRGEGVVMDWRGRERNEKLLSDNFSNL